MPIARRDFLKSGLAATAAICLAADSAAVIVRVPAGSVLLNANGRLSIGDTVIDFHSG